MKKILPFVLAFAVGAGALFGLSEADAGIIEDTIDTLKKEDMVDERPPHVPNVPILDADIVKDVVTDLKDLPGNNGFLGVARKNGVSTGQVRAIYRAVQAKLRELAEAE